MPEQPILVIDDDQSILDTVNDILEDAGYRVITARDGAMGLALVEHAQPCLVLLDMRMPVLDGWGFARALHSRAINLPIIVMTAAQDARQWAYEIGATRYLAKPFDLDDLLAVVEQVLRLGEQEQVT